MSIYYWTSELLAYSLQPIYLFEVKSLCPSYRSSISIRLNFYGGDVYAG